MLPLGALCLTPLRLAEHAAHPLPPAAPIAAAEDRATCIEPNALGRSQGLGGGFDETFETEHFLLAWSPDNAAVTEDQVSIYADTLENSWSVQFDALGWLPPDQTDACRITVLLADFDDSWGDTGGYTDVEADGGVPYLALNTDWLEYGDDWTRTLVAHELNHASQFAYNVFWDESDWWYWESTAEWITDEVYDDANTYTWSLWAYLDTPWRSLDSMRGTVQYGHFAFNTWMTEAYGVDAPRDVWAAATPAIGMIEATESVLAIDFDDAVASYSSHVAAMDVAERNVWLEALGYFELDPWTHVDTWPAGGEVAAAAAPQERGQNFFHFQSVTPSDLTFSIIGDAEVDGVATEWALAVAEVDAGGGVTHRWVRGSDEGLGTVTVAGFGGEVPEVYVAVIPMGEIGENGAGYTWSADVREERGDDTGADDTGDSGGKDEESPAACGCDATSGGAPWGLALGAALLLRRRARRS